MAEYRPRADPVPGHLEPAEIVLEELNENACSLALNEFTLNRTSPLLNQLLTGNPGGKRRPARAA